MNCLRCARETSGQQVFCDACLDDMTQHPVKSDTPIYLPTRKVNAAPKTKRRFRRERTAEEMVVILRKRIRVLAVLVLILSMMLAAAEAGVWLAKKQGADLSMPNIGQNFQSITDFFKYHNEE